MNYDLAQVNVSRLLAPLDSTLLEPFVAALNEVNAEGDRAPGFVWRLQTESGNATDVEGFGWDVAGSHGVIVNLTTWTSTRRSRTSCSVAATSRSCVDDASGSTPSPRPPPRSGGCPQEPVPASRSQRTAFATCDGADPPKTPSPCAATTRPRMR